MVYCEEVIYQLCMVENRERYWKISKKLKYLSDSLNLLVYQSLLLACTYASCIK